MSDAPVRDQRTATERERSYLPGMRRSWLLPVYDLLTGVAKVRPLHRRAVELAGVRPGEAVLDVGCGTGNLALTVLAAEPAARVTGLDPDGSALGRAARKARRRGVSLELVQGFADRLPLEDGSVDHVLSALALHHLEGDDSAAFAREALRVLRPGGTVTIVDVGGGAGDHEHEHGHGRSGWLRRRHGHPIQDLPTVARNHGDGIPALLREAGFADAHEVDHAEHRFGRITFVQATRPE